MGPMLSAREAAEVLASRGLADGRTRRWARGMGRRVLASGLAGEPVRSAGTTWYDAHRITELAGWRAADLTSLPPPCDDALLVLRGRPDATPRDWSLLSNAGLVAAAEMSIVLRRLGVLPVVVTTCGYVVGGAEVTAVRRETKATLRLELRPSGDWFSAFHRCVLHTSAGNHWQLRYPRISRPGSSGWLGSP